ncbi:immunoglobulin superfamily member 3-like [Gopherus flavomarginatus]|uniref:immunoglobulin superfamily member 3-like n=1 Tax=Gopherus flavomarginatus TaxID=286002 RepID=UPI0021CBB521|nr:immunoglobulin superfamily member 3-like [Gopherus flavomarginatus]
MKLKVPLVFLHLYLSCCEPQVIQSPESLVTGEGKVSTMSCSFTSAYQTFYWYQQLPGKGLTYLLTASSNKNVTVGQRFIGERLEDGERSSLHIADSQLRDSGSYLCAVEHSDTDGEVDTKVSQPAALSFLAGGSSDLPCNHSVAGYDRVIWYYQSPGSAPRAVISGYNSAETSERFELSIDLSSRFAPLRITKVAVEDSGVYYCAVRDTARGNAGRAEQKPPRV